MTRHVFFLILTLLLAHADANSQFKWLTEFPGPDYTGVEGLAIDANDDLFVVGNFNNGVDLPGVSYTNRGSFLLKLTKDGTPLWHRIIRYPESDFWSFGHIGMDAHGNVFIGGLIPESVTIGGVSVTGTGRFSTAIAKFDTDGNLIWTRVIDNVQGLFDMKVNASGKVLLYAQHIGYGTITAGDKNKYVGFNSVGILLDADGSVRWIKGLGDPARYNTRPKACALDDQGNAYFHGIFNGSLSIGSKQVVSTGGHYDFFFVRINEDETCAWLSFAERKIPELEPLNPPNGISIERGAIEVDNTGSLYAAGNNWHGVKIGSTIQPGDNAFIAKFDNNDGTLTWINDLPNTSSYSNVENIIISHGNIHVSGVIPSQLFVTSYTTDGALLDQIMIQVRADISSSLAFDSDQHIYMSGRTIDFLLEGFVFRYEPNTLPQQANEIYANAVCQHGTINASTSPIADALRYEWEINYNDKTVYSTTFQPTLLFGPPEGFQDKPVSIRVRGANDQGNGAYSPMHDIPVKTTPVPILEKSCTQIILQNSGPDLMWFEDGKKVDIPSTNTAIEPRTSGNWYVTITDECGTATSNEVAFESVDHIFIPNIITPNGDELNDFFVIDARLLESGLRVFNRWGTEVYSSLNYNNKWDGGDLPSGVYYYQLRDHCLTAPIVGPLTITR